MLNSISTNEAPAAIGSYSQAIKVANVIYLSGQIPIDPKTGELIAGDFQAQVQQVFANLKAVAMASGGGLPHLVKLTVYLIDINQIVVVNNIMKDLFEIFPARTSVQVSALPKGVPIEIDAIMVLPENGLN